MSDSHPDAHLVRAFYEAFSVEPYQAAVRQFLDDRVIWHVAGDNPLAGDFHGADAVLETMHRFGEHSRHTLRLDTRSVFADDEHVVAVHVATARHGDVRYRAHEIDVFHVEDARITELWSFSEDQDATDALWSSSP